MFVYPGVITCPALQTWGGRSVTSSRAVVVERVESRIEVGVSEGWGSYAAHPKTSTCPTLPSARASPALIRPPSADSTNSDPRSSAPAHPCPVIAAITTAGPGLAAGVVATPAQAQTTAAAGWTFVAFYDTKAACVDAAQQYEREGWQTRRIHPYEHPRWVLSIWE
jgi:hypothetical protein